MSLRLNGSTSGYVELDAPATAGSNTLVLPDGNGTSGQYLQTNGSGGLSWQTVTVPADTNLTRGTSQSLSGNTAVTFSSIPSDVKRVFISIDRYSANVNAYPRVKLGYSNGTFQSTGYEFLSTYSSTATSYYPAQNVGYFDIYHFHQGTAFTGHMMLTNISGNIWVQSHSGGSYGWSTSHSGGGYAALLGTLDTIEISSSTGTMDGGTVNIFYEV
jgi:hypothetical protein